MSQPGIPGGVAFGRIVEIMKGAVNLDSQPNGVAVEIQHIGPDRMLTPEPKAFEAVGSERQP